MLALGEFQEHKFLRRDQDEEAFLRGGYNEHDVS